MRGGARQRGFGYIDPPVTPGFDQVIQPGEALSVMLLLEDGQVAYGDCIDVIFVTAITTVTGSAVAEVSVTVTTATAAASPLTGPCVSR